MKKLLVVAVVIFSAQQMGASEAAQNLGRKIYDLTSALEQGQSSNTKLEVKMQAAMPKLDRAKAELEQVNAEVAKRQAAVDDIQQQLSAIAMDMEAKRDELSLNERERDRMSPEGRADVDKMVDALQNEARAKTAKKQAKKQSMVGG